MAGSSEPPITVRPSTLVRDLKGLLRFPGAGEEEAAVAIAGATAWPRLFQSVRLVLEEEEDEDEGEGYTVWAHRSWLARRCPYFGRALASGTFVWGGVVSWVVVGWRGMDWWVVGGVSGRASVFWGWGVLWWGFGVRRQDSREGLL